MDASIYRIVPQVVVRPKDVDEVRALLAYATAHGRHLTFRTAGTSLSGQALTDDILVELAPYWKGLRVLDEGRRVWAQPGVVGGYVNRVLAPHGCRIGPDPASIDAAMIGGIVSNNSSGMCCGTAENAYRTLERMTVLLADGTLVDTGADDADARLRLAHPRLFDGLAELRDEVRRDEALAARIRAKFSRKNTTGYSLNAFLDYDRPVDILAHLVVGAEGTLAFLADVTLKTVPEPPARATALLYFRELTDAGAAVFPLAQAGAVALEIMDAASLRSQADDRAYPFAIEAETAALLVELRAGDAARLAEAIAEATAAVAPFPLLAPVAFSTDPAEREQHWKLRKGLFPSVGGMRPPGTAVVIEDVVVPVERLADAIRDLRALFVQHGMPETILFGHAKDGNLHFVLAEDFGDARAVARYDALMRGLVALVVGTYDGALKAEHGAGRNMAPFVKDEWGEAAYRVMQRVKELFDPKGILNPGVILSDDPLLHLKDLKPLPPISPLADRCIECGFCEPRCPSREVTLTPRQRITVTREIARLSRVDSEEARRVRASLLDDFAYEGLATCVGDSMCQTSCPVKIDTGLLMKEVRHAGHPEAARRTARAVARRFRLLTRAVRASLAAAAAVRALPGGAALVDRLSGLGHRVFPAIVPRVPPGLALPRPSPWLPRPRVEVGPRGRVVYFPSCLTRMLGPLPGEPERPALPVAMLDVLGAAGFGVAYPEELGSLCCGMPFASKAFSEAAEDAAARALRALLEASEGGRLVVVTDASPCAGTLQSAVRSADDATRDLTVLDFPSFWARQVLPHLPAPPRRPGLAVLHPTCTLMKTGGLPDLLAVARAHSESVLVPPGVECCGFAGDRGFLVPEVTQSATLREAAEVRAADPAGQAGLYSTCRTCEIGMGRAVERPYASLVHLVHEAFASRAAPSRG